MPAAGLLFTLYGTLCRRLLIRGILAFVEVRTRAAVKGKIVLPELSVGREKH